MRHLFSALALASLTASVFLVTACADDDDDQNAAGSEDDIKKKGGVAEGGACDAQKKCKTGLLCKSSGAPVSSHNGRPVMGMIIRSTTCQQPEPGEEGGSCSSASPCEAGLVCEYPANSSSSGGAHFPPGAMGMPAPRKGTCKASGGPPPGAMGMPAPHN